MNQPPLNPDAFASAEEYCATYGEYSTFREQLRMGIRAYLAVAQPLVNSEKELDALPEGSVIRGYDGIVYKVTESNSHGNVFSMPGFGDRMYGFEISVPARVLDLLEVKP